MNPRHCIQAIAVSACAMALLCAATGASAQSESAVEPDRPAAPARTTSSRRSYPLVNVSEAQRRLAQAELKRKQGKAPLPGEREQDSGALTYAYWRRQEKLRIEVEQAQSRANAVKQPLLARQ